MTTACVIFSHEGDAGLVPHTAARAMQLGCTVTVADDNHKPMPEETRTQLAALDCRVVETGFNRKGNLNGTECVAGMLDVFREAAKAHGADTIVKIDPDMWLGSLGWLPKDGEAGAGFDHRGIWMGCYAMLAEVIRRVRRGVLNDQWNCRLPEAFAIGRHLLRLGAVAHPVAGRLTAWTPGIDPTAHDVVLMGRWPRWAREEGMRRLTASLGE